MRIISKFKDYYDIGQSLGVEPSIVYPREKKVIEITHDEAWHLKMGGGGSSSHYSKNIDFRFYYFAIGLCGKVYKDSFRKPKRS